MSTKEKSMKSKHHKLHKKPNQTRGISQEGLSKINNNHTADYLSGFWPQSHAQKLFPAISDPTVCGYPIQFGYPIDQVALPIYPIIPASPVTQTFKTLVSYPDFKPRKKRQDMFQSVNQKETQYTSLPPGTAGECGSDQRRRFSDPGLANSQQSEETCSSDSSSDSGLNYGEHISNLVSENKRLTDEMNALRQELHSLKLEINTLLDLQHSFPAGAITDMIREVESALGLREKAFMAKTQQIVKERLSNISVVQSENTSIDKSPTKEEFEVLKSKLVEVSSDRDLLCSRVAKLELLVENFMKESNVQEVKQSSRILSLEQEDTKLRKQIQDVIEQQKLGSSMRSKVYVSKLISSSSNEEKDKCDGTNILSSLDTCESLSSSIGSGSLHSPLVTMSGPVTNV